MIKDGRIVVELPEDWKKIIGALREGDGRIEDIASRSGVKVWKARKIVSGMKLLGIVRINVLPSKALEFLFCLYTPDPVFVI